VDNETRSGFVRRLLRAGCNLLVVAYVAGLALYFGLRGLGGGGLWYVEALGYVLPWLFAPLLLLVPLVLLLRSRVLLILVALPVAAFLLLYGGLYLPRRPVAAGGQTFTVLTYNINGRNREVEAIAAQIERYDPDVVALHEVNATMHKALKARLLDRYPYQQREPGIGLYSRLPIEDYQAYRLGGEEGPWAQQGRLLVDGQTVTLLNAHPRTPTGELRHFATSGHAADVGDLLARVEGIDGPLLVVGDLNLTDQNTGYRALARRLHDAYREAGRGLGFTFRGSEGGPALWRIDFVLHTPDLAALDVALGDYGGSDHRPLVATLAWGR
jgi:vancomycin resistance protein VanJ